MPVRQRLFLVKSQRAPDPGLGVVFERAAEVFALLGTPLRLRILALLCEHEMNVTQLRIALGGAQPSVSQNLATLYRSGVLVRQRKGPHVFYSVNSSHSLLLCDAVRSMIGSAAAGH